MRRAKTEVEYTIQTGIKGLDDIFLGGIKKNNIILVEGGPGSGKTTFGLEFIYKGAKEFKENGLIISFELTPDKLIRDARGFGWDFGELEKKKKLKILYTTPAAILDDLQSPDSLLMTQIREVDAKRVLIDGITPLKIFGELVNGRPFRDSLHSLVESLQRYGVTAVLTKELPEYTAKTNDANHAQYICDTIVTLTHSTNRRNTHRYLEIKKSRGQDFIQGQHTLRIEGGEGLAVYRRTQSRPKEYDDQATSTERSSSGIPSMDSLLGGGIYDGSATLVAGISGTGKTIMGVQFLIEGAREGKHGLMVTLDEHPQQMIRNAQTLGLEFKKYVDEGLITIYYESPLELELDVHFHNVMEITEKKNIKRVVIDSLAAYEVTGLHESHEFVYSLSTYFKDRLCATFFNYESPELLGVSQISQELRASAIVDNIILLNYVEISTQMRRAITVPKVRGSAIPQRTREFVIEHGGIHLLDEDEGLTGEVNEVPQLPFSSYYGVLSRAPARKSPVIEEKIAKGDGMPESTMN